MIIAIVLDTSASMARRFSQGLSALDAAKAATEYLIKTRGRGQARGAAGAGARDNFFIVTFSATEPVVVSWRHSTMEAVERLKYIDVDGLSSPGVPLAAALDLVNHHRMKSGIDNVAMGRLPTSFDPALIITFTDGGPVTTPDSVLSQLILPASALPGRELYVEPFRWDQRIFNIVLAPPTSRAEAVLAACPLTPMVDVTGGRSLVATSMKALMYCMDSLLGNVKGATPAAPPATGPMLQTGVVVDWEEACVVDDGRGGRTVQLNGPAGPLSSPKRLIYINKSGPKCAWPIPEAFNVDAQMTQLPKRTAHPVVTFVPIDLAPVLLEAFPFDKYELESCPMTAALLARPLGCWHVFVRNSLGDGTLGRAFGYLKANTSKTAVNLFVMPYNFPELLDLLQHVAKDQSASVSRYRERFQAYLLSVPLYYHQYIKAGFKRASLVQLYTMELPAETALLSPAVLAMLRKHKNTHRIDFDRAAYRIYRGEAEGDLDTIERDAASDSQASDAPLQPSRKRVPLSAAVHAPVDVDRRYLLDAVTSMRQLLTDGAASSRWLHQSPFAMDDDKFSVPISAMGDFLAVMRRQEELRDALAFDGPQHRKPFFGNPFRSEKRMMVDEADEAGAGSVMPQQGAPLPRKRARHALRSGGTSPSSSPAQSPSPSPSSSPVLAPVPGAPETIGFSFGMDLALLDAMDAVNIDLGTAASEPMLFAEEEAASVAEEMVEESPAASVPNTDAPSESEGEAEAPDDALVQLACAFARRLIRTPGRPASAIMARLRDLALPPRGSPARSPATSAALDALVAEARRFKRRSLAQQLVDA